MIPSLLPCFNANDRKLYSGSLIPLTSFCRKNISKKPECIKFYLELMSKSEAFYECPFGFTCYKFDFYGQCWTITGLIGFPRFNSEKERGIAKKYPENKIAREAVRNIRKFYSDLEQLRIETIERASKIIPQAFHELRKLNATILQNAEKELRTSVNNKSLLNIRSASELMRNNFDILEALSNPEGMKALPTDATINLFDLTWKTKCILQEKAATRKINLDVINGARPIIRGSQKSFPIVPAVLVENAIKYGRAGSSIKIEVNARNNLAILQVENESDFPIDPESCFKKGTRYAGGAFEGGGLGLFIAKEIIIAHSGEIRCVIEGATVKMVVTLPLKEIIK